MPPPAIVLVPGLWEGPAVFAATAHALETKGFAPAPIVTLPSWGTRSPGNPSMGDDSVAIRAAVAPLVEAGRSVVLVLHSAAGFLGSSAVEGLSVRARTAQGREGGVARIVFVTAGVLTEGAEHGTPPFAYNEDGVMHCKDYEGLFFNDLDTDEKTHWMKVLRSHPAEGWGQTTTYCGWREVPSVYALCLKDAILPAQLQRHFAETAGSKTIEVDAGHVPMIKKPDEIIAIIEQAALSV